MHVMVSLRDAEVDVFHSSTGWYLVQKMMALSLGSNVATPCGNGSLCTFGVDVHVSVHALNVFGCCCGGGTSFFVGLSSTGPGSDCTDDDDVDANEGLPSMALLLLLW